MSTGHAVSRRTTVIDSTKRLVALSVACLTVVALAACGGSSGLPAGAVAQVGSTTITKATLDHWIAALFGQDYYEHAGGVAPKGLIAEPPGYTTCPAALEAIASGATKSHTKRSAAQLQHKCRQLNVVMRQRAMTYLISSQWTAGLAVAYGVKITGGEVKQQFERLKAELFPTEADLQAYLVNRGWTLSDELFSARKELLSVKVLRQLTKSTDAVAPLLKKWIAVTNCRPGYVVEQCKQYQASKAPSTNPSISALIGEVAALTRPAESG